MSDTGPAPFAFLHSTHRVRFAPGAVEDIGSVAKDIGARRIAFVVDGFFAGGAVEERLRDLVRPHDPEPAVYACPPHEPDTSSVGSCLDAIGRAGDPDLVVAVGGGSAMDTAKVARMLLANPGAPDAIAGIGTPMNPHPSLFVCVPTTAGTGSEVSESAVISKKGTDYKLIYRSPGMSARVALLDPELGVSAPAGATANAGYDAVTHAVEAYVSRMASPITDALAVSAMEILAEWLPVACRERGNVEARGACLVAACQAGIAFNSANLGLAHALSAPLGALFGVPHGLGNALALPAVTAYNEPSLGAKAATLARIFGGSGPADGLGQLRAAVGLDRGLDDFVGDDDGREALVQAAMKSGQVRMNPRTATVEHMRAIVAAMRAPLAGAAPQVDAR